MHLGLVLDMTSAGFPDRTAVAYGDARLRYDELGRRSAAASSRFLELEVPSVVYLGGNHPAYPVALFGAAGAGIPLIPLNYRLGIDQLAAQLTAHAGSFVVFEGEAPPGIEPARLAERQAFLEQLAADGDVAPPLPVDPDLPAVLLYTSGTTAAPKAAVLRHRHLMSYVLGTVEFGAAGEDERALVSVPPYHVAGLANLLSNLYAGRPIVYLDRFSPEAWLDVVRSQGITQAMVVPTMLARIVEHLSGQPDAATPSLRTLSYGGARMPQPVLERALALFPGTGFVNAYGLTETSSTIAVLGPDDHRAALESDDPAVRRRLGSAGRPLPGIEVEVRDEEGTVLGPDEVGLVFLRGEQISGEYAGAVLLDAEGWFPTRDRGWIDREGYLFIEGRADDTIIRGGENIAPAEIEDVLVSHEDVVEAAVVGLPDEEWGQRLAAVVVVRPGATIAGEELRQLVRDRLRSSKTPETIEIWAELPRTDTGKLLRRRVVERLAG